MNFVSWMTLMGAMRSDHSSSALEAG